MKKETGEVSFFVPPRGSKGIGGYDELFLAAESDQF